jgi:ketosteroid isomerase-like protein
MSPDNLRAARRLYDAFGSQDPRALLAALAPGFRESVSDGMPEGLGGSYDGAEAMLRDCWARVFALLDVRPVPVEYLPAGGDRVVVIGRYLGTARATGRPLSAAFAHVIRLADGLLTELVQITDTERWHEALAGQHPCCWGADRHVVVHEGHAHRALLTPGRGGTCTG